MTDRTLVLGIPLPHASFDNYSFISAPSFSEYSRLIVDMESISRVVLEVIDGQVSHSTFAVQPVVNAPTTARAFSLADVIPMREREAGQFFADGGLAVCFACPDAPVEGIEGLGAWRIYGWLPQSEHFRYAEHLLPGFGRAPVHPSGGYTFSPYVEKFGAALAYRCHADEAALARAGGQVFGRSTGGAAVAFELPLAPSRIVFLPPFTGPDADRMEIARTLFQGLEDMAASAPPAAPGWMRKGAP